MQALRVPISSFENQVRSLRVHFAWVQVEQVDWQYYVQIFTWSQWAFETFLLARQYRNYGKKEVPAALTSDLSVETFNKSQDYGRDKARFSFVSSFFHQVLQSLTIHYGLYPKAWEMAGDSLNILPPSWNTEIMQSVVFVLGLSFVSSIIEIPFSIFSTFGLEAKHGFNKTTVGTFVGDIVKMWALGGLIGGVFLAAFLKVIEWAGDSFVPFLMAFLIGFQMIMIVVYPTFIQPLFNTLTPLPAGELRGRIEKLATSLNYPLTKLYQMDGSKRSAHSNAYMYGLPWSKHIVVFDTLIEQSQASEVEAVIAHELGHWHFNHPMKLLFVSQFHLFFIFTSFAIFQHSTPLLKAFGFPNSVAMKPPTMLSFWIFQLLLTPTEAVLSFLMNGISRHFEWQADHFAADLPHRLGAQYVVEKELPSMGDRLGKALTTLHVKNLSTVWVDWLFSAYHHSHPTLTERLKALDEYKTMAAARIRKEL